MKTKFIINRKDINEKLSCIYCDARPYFYIQNAYIKGDSKSEMFASNDFWKTYEKQMINLKIIGDGK